MTQNQPPKRPRTPSAWDTGPRLRAVAILGAVVAFVVAATHPTDSVIVGGDDGMVFPSAVVLVLAPLVVCLAVAWGRSARRRYVQRVLAWEAQYEQWQETAE